MRRAAFVEVRMLAGLLGGDATSGIVDQHVLQQREAVVVEVVAEGDCLVADPFGERGLEVWEACLILDARPVDFGGSTKEPCYISRVTQAGTRSLLEDLEDLINLRISWEERLSRAHLCEDTPNRPHIHTSRVLTPSKQNLRRTIPESYDFVGIGSKRDSKSTSKTEISQLEVAIAVDEQILGLKIAMQDPMTVAVSHALAQLAHKLLDHRVAQTQSL